MRIVFSNPLQLHRVGAGRPYGRLHDYLLTIQNRHKVKFISGYELVKKLYSGMPVPPESLEQGAMSDMIASLDGDLACDVFLGAGCASLSQMREAEYMVGEDFPPKFITTWFSTHYRNAMQVLESEYRAFGVKGSIVDPYLVWRAQKEQARSDAIIVPSEYCRTTYESDPDCRGKVHVVNFGVDSDTYHPAEQPPEDFRVLFDGGNWARKGLRYLLTAWSELKILGLLTVLGVPKRTFPSVWRTSYAGWVPDEQHPQYLRNHTVFCLPSLEEGQALVVLEAMASGLPVIVTEAAGAPIEDGKEGLIVPPRDIPKLKDALQYFHDNPDEVKKMGKAARKKVETMTWEKFGDGVLQVCEEVAKN